MIKQKLDELVDKHLIKNPIWQSDFFKRLETNPSTDNWQMLVIWVENMIRASYGFQTYVLLLAAKAPDESIRRLLVENEWEELGDYEYPKRSHFQMVCRLAKLCGIAEQNIKWPRLLPTSQKHIKTHIERCKNASLFYGLGMIFLIENLTKIEFEKVLRGFIKNWEGATGSTIEEFAVSGGIEYFTSNMEADKGHAEDIERMIITALEYEGVDLKDDMQVAPYLQEISDGMAESIALRTGFMQGVHNAVYAEEKVLEVA
jgi:pyrroloquinoline quinone (PQQ) biosynthesis protein C